MVYKARAMGALAKNDRGSRWRLLEFEKIAVSLARQIMQGVKCSARSIAAGAFDDGRDRCVRRIQNLYRKTSTFVANGLELWALDAFAD